MDQLYARVSDQHLHRLLDAMAHIEATLSHVSAQAAAPSAIAVLFISTRMRALQMTDNKGSPQGWVQDGMYLATWSIMIQSRERQGDSPLKAVGFRES